MDSGGMEETSKNLAETYRKLYWYVVLYQSSVAHKQQFFFLFQITYKMVLAFNKLSFLFLYHRVFQIRWFQMICFITIGIVVSGTFSFVIATVFQCVPVHKSWNRKSAGHCINNAAFRWAWASWNTLMDLWVCLMPVPVISRLQMDPGKRAGLLVVFLLGIFVCVTSVIRMHALTSSVATTDPTWGSLPAFVWSAVEASTGLICACLPSLKQPISRCFPNLFQLTRSRSSGNTYEMGKSGAGSNSRNRQHRSSQWKEDWGDKRSTTVSASRLGGRQDSGDSTERIINSGIMRTTDISMKSEGASASLVDQKTAREVY